MLQEHLFEPRLQPIHRLRFLVTAIMCRVYQFPRSVEQDLCTFPIEVIVFLHVDIQLFQKFDVIRVRNRLEGLVLGAVVVCIKFG